MAAVLSLIGIPTAFLVTMLALLVAGGTVSPAFGVVLIGTVVFVFGVLFRHARQIEHAEDAAQHRRA